MTYRKKASKSSHIGALLTQFFIKLLTFGWFRHGKGGLITLYYRGYLVLVLLLYTTSWSIITLWV